MEHRAHILRKASESNYRQYVFAAYGINNPDLNNIIAPFAKAFNDQATLNWLSLQHPTYPEPLDVNMIAMMALFPAVAGLVGAGAVDTRSIRMSNLVRSAQVAGYGDYETDNVTEVYKGEGHHWTPHWLGYRTLGLPDWFMESRFNIMGRSITGGYELMRGEMSIRHALADPTFSGAKMKLGMQPWKASKFGIETVPRPLRWWYAMPDATKATLGGFDAAGAAWGLWDLYDQNGK